MATGTAGLTVVDQVVQDLQNNESKTKKKANTVTTAIGSVATFVAAGLSALVENGTSLPSWFPFLVVVVGMISTTYGVSKTKNGVTDSLADRLHDEIARRIDENHFHDEEVTTEIPIQQAPVGEANETNVDDLRAIAENIVRSIR
ncbi:holin [Gordonia Phage Odesza]|uniref:Holin n=5 Tax=Tanisvirus tanis TaxID=2844677 RepID=A0A7D5G3P8_9CAUD|nr:holin [Gordonia phage Tanis]AVO25251.1 holin [Gordonia phage Gravy]AVO25344.1 holin [Gordonia phage Kerry]QGJ89621.1 holin [Gordonia Phage Odesza]QLF83726.1 holin [Gordonia phage Magel]QYW00649.1 holin [Gordonia phage Roney]